MALAACDGQFDCLPYRDEPYRATLDEIEEHFVGRAPVDTRSRRGLIMRALRLHCDIVDRIADRQEITTKTILDGGFVTWKPNIPEDADLVVVVPPQTFSHFTKESLLPLWTLSAVNATLGEDGLEVASGELKPGFGLVDCYVAPMLPTALNRWHNTWSTVRDPETRDIVDGARKGYIEVVRER
ncbi:DUF6932 family protein [Mycolicibacterium fortuitum]|uniref:DUF6932 family protein n=1 Tax=Mycolicibacterium fortuitum TaxID=1766 RepID=UPI002952CC6E|nr:hypothetical protein [Mycolicibacterium fortuitum]MDV7195812.1 hypothetical protein [Mycolicibacterium fortuitum]MDV7302859.1 hypothetical protein [Mycolicibacterium fortuitum]